MQGQVSPVLSCSSLWAGFSNLGCVGQPLREASSGLNVQNGKA